ncbi:MAG: LysM peptidoglycan-binding domain-containing protein [Ilumatobacteraceae bacterium]
MATIILNGQLRPTSVRPAATRPTSRGTRTANSATRRQALRDAARTREIKRVYRRRRFGIMALVATFAAATTFSVFSLFGSSAAADGTSGRSVAPKYVVAQSGDTLWSIGERIAPNAPITEVVDELVRLNGTSIQTGQLVRIP